MGGRLAFTFLPLKLVELLMILVTKRIHKPTDLVQSKEPGHLRQMAICSPRQGRYNLSLEVSQQHRGPKDHNWSIRQIMTVGLEPEELDRGQAFEPVVKESGRGDKLPQEFWKPL